MELLDKGTGDEVKITDVGKYRSFAKYSVRVPIPKVIDLYKEKADVKQFFPPGFHFVLYVSFLAGESDIPNGDRLESVSNCRSGGYHCCDRGQNDAN